MTYYFRNMIKPMVIQKREDNRDEFRKPQQHQEQMAEAFPSWVEASRFHLWKLGDPIASSGARWLVGIWTVKHHDLEMLDILNDALENSIIQNVRLDVFNSLYLSSWEELAFYIPNLPEVAVTPYIGLWLDGEFQQSASGFAAKKWLLDTYNLPHTLT